MRPERGHYIKSPIKCTKSPEEYQRVYDGLLRRRDKLLDELQTCEAAMVSRLEYRLRDVRRRLASTAVLIGVASGIQANARGPWRPGSVAVEVTRGGVVEWQWAIPHNGETIAAMCERLRAELRADACGPK